MKLAEESETVSSVGKDHANHGDWNIGRTNFEHRRARWHRCSNRRSLRDVDRLVRYGRLQICVCVEESVEVQTTSGAIFVRTFQFEWQTARFDPPGLCATQIH